MLQNENGIITYKEEDECILPLWEHPKTVHKAATSLMILDGQHLRKQLMGEADSRKSPRIAFQQCNGTSIRHYQNEGSCACGPYIYLSPSQQENHFSMHIQCTFILFMKWDFLFLHFLSQLQKAKYALINKGKLSAVIFTYCVETLCFLWILIHQYVQIFFKCVDWLYQVATWISGADGKIPGEI